MSLADEIYMKHHVSELRDLDEVVVKLWKEGQDRKLDRIANYGKGEGYNFDNDGVGGYGSSGRKPLPKEFHNKEK
jgi:hypothetical protein